MISKKVSRKIRMTKAEECFRGLPVWNLILELEEPFKVLLKVSRVLNKVNNIRKLFHLLIT